jgi:hypothetical protein
MLRTKSFTLYAGLLLVAGLDLFQRGAQSAAAATDSAFLGPCLTPSRTQNNACSEQGEGKRSHLLGNSFQTLTSPLSNSTSKSRLYRPKACPRHLLDVGGFSRSGPQRARDGVLALLCPSALSVLVGELGRHVKPSFPSLGGSAGTRSDLLFLSFVRTPHLRQRPPMSARAQ